MTRKRLEELLGRLEPAMAKRYRQVMQRVRSKRTLAQLEAALEGGAGPLVGAILDDIDAATAVLASRAAAAHTLVAQEVAAALSTVLDELVDYDATNVRAVNALTRSRYALISHINEEQRQAIGEALRIGQVNGWNPRKTAVLIRDSIGLTPHQTGIVANYRRSLEQLDRKALSYKLRDARSDKTVASAIERGVEIPPKQIDKMVGRYADRQLALRAETIARTETLRAIHEGQDEGYQQAIDAGKLEQSRLQCRWHAGTAPRTRNWHASMNGQKRRHGVPFRSGQGNELRYPCESGAPASEVINCRCGKSVRVLPVGQVAIDSDPGDEPGSATSAA